MKKRVVIAATPVVSGTYSFYSRLRTALDDHGWEVTGVSFIGSKWDPSFEDHGCIALAEGREEQGEQARRFLDFCQNYEPDIVIPANSSVITSVIPHLPKRTRVLMRCNSTTPRAYHFVSVHPEYVGGVVTESLRQVRDLVTEWQVSENHIHTIPHGIDLDAYRHCRAVEKQLPASEIRLLYLGRLHDAHKGILLIPEIVEKIERAGVSYRLDIVGNGPDGGRLRRRLAGNDKVHFRGHVPPSRVPGLLRGTNILLMPSKVEGFGLVLIEAMAAGVVPVASRIELVTDWIVEQGKTGILCPIGDSEAFADAIVWLYRDRTKLSAMSQNAHAEAERRFSIERFGQAYHSLFTNLLQNEQPHRPAPLPFSMWKPFQDYSPPQPLWKRAIPDRIKRVYRSARRVYRSVQ